MHDHTKYMRIWRKKNPNYYKTKKWKRYKRVWMKEKRNTAKKFYRQELVKNKIWKRKNRAKINDYRKRYDKEKKMKDVSFKILCNLRSRISNILRKRNSKSLSTMFLIGCSIDYLMCHLQKQFKKSMTWNNYGKWHIDHKIPCAGFNLSEPNEQMQCFNYRNLQPLWAKENLKKNRY